MSNIRFCFFATAFAYFAKVAMAKKKIYVDSTAEYWQTGIKKHFMQDTLGEVKNG